MPFLLYYHRIIFIDYQLNIFRIYYLNQLLLVILQQNLNDIYSVMMRKGINSE